MFKNISTHIFNGASLLGFGLFGSLLIANINSQIYKTFKYNYTKHKLIKWSKDGSDFIGPVEWTPEHTILNGKIFTSPNKQTSVYLTSKYIWIEKQSTNEHTRKILHPDGNTEYYLEYDLHENKTLYAKKYSLDGNELYLDFDAERKLPIP